MSGPESWPGIPGYPELWPKEDDAAAKQLLAEAGFPDAKGLPTLHLSYVSSTLSAKLLAM